MNAGAQWHHVVFTKDASQNLKVYVDGADRTPAGTHTHTTAFTDADTEIGRFSSSVIPNFQGSIDEVWVYDRALDQSEARDLVHYNTLQPDQRAILHYSFDTRDISGTTVADLSPAGNDGTMVNTPTPVSAGRFGQALGFGSLDSVDVGKPLLSTTDETQPYTISLWLKSDGSSGGGPFSQYIGDPSVDRFGLRIDINGGHPSWWAGDSADRIVASTTNVNDQQWHHIVFVKDEWQNLRVYVDEIDETPSGGPWTHTTAFTDANTEIGRFADTVINNLAGSIDEVWVFTYALRPSEIHNLHIVNNIAPEPGTLTLLALGLIGYARRRGRLPR